MRKKVVFVPVRNKYKELVCDEKPYKADRDCCFWNCYFHSFGKELLRFDPCTKHSRLRGEKPVCPWRTAGFYGCYKLLEENNENF